LIDCLFRISQDGAMPCGNSRRSCNARCFHPGGPDCRSCQLPLPLRAAFGAALSDLSHRRDHRACRQCRDHADLQAGGDGFGADAMGLAFAFGWTPCIGPILAAILSIAAAEATVTKGAGLLAVYSAGLGIPFLLAAFMIEQFSSLFARMKRHLGKVEHAMGILMVITGIGFLTGSVTSISIWLLETFPALQNFG